MEKIRFNPIPLPPITVKDKKPVNSNGKSFSEELNGAITQTNSLKISKHANDRLSERRITITDSQWKKVEEKVTEAKSKGIKDSLVLLDQAALIVSIKNGTVITAMGAQDIKEHIFTDIDGTIILND
ncbi:TIGR02530 family flagellar biosynthesis protein [Jeotgalibacillus sp. ET6]|uniref:TIGR02530 family flagellar biosynthesis protein n=1 Tax=Jeotgalibacillus sp. ET6 TaxID=3037260 RepID=UPI0024189763|nr:TIGR02530 family flagellar biosynthesis protein [Jeotgalibacillus sp. ET6]MDG5470294.1 TIGR02530 family flagellar biosynthesis protein [Jeotgalibacillus sp. ET6]